MNVQNLRDVHQTTPSVDAAATVQWIQSLSPHLQSPSGIVDAENLRHYFDRVINDVWYSFHVDDAADSTRFGSMQQRYREAGDDIGVAVCKMMEGDSFASPYFTNITLLNLVLVEGSGVDARNQKWDIIEQDIAIPDFARAERCYDEALAGFTISGAQRGIGTVHLRRACIRHLSAMGSHDKETRTRLLEQTQSLLVDAERIADICGDGCLLQFVKLHQILVEICLGRVDKVSENARSIGSWGFSTGNIQFAHCLGLLLLRYGRRRSIESTNADIARACYEAARYVFKELKALVSEFQATVSLAVLLRNLGDYASARNEHDIAESLLSDIVRALNAVPRIGPQYHMQAKTKWPHLLFTELFTIYDTLQGSERLRQMADRIGPDGLIPGSTTLDWSSKRHAQLLFEWRETKLRYRARVRRDQLVEAKQILLDRILSLSDGVDAGPAGPADSPELRYTRRVAQINLLTELGDFSEARTVLERLDNAGYLGAHSIALSASTSIPVVRVQEEITKARISFNLCVRAKDFRRAEKFFNQVQERDELYYSSGRGDELGREWGALLLGGLMQEGLGKKDKALDMFQRGAYIAETHRTALHDPVLQLTSFGQDDIGSIFLSAARICVEYNDLVSHSPPQQFDCVPPLKGVTWAEQALLFLEQGKARHLLDSIVNRPYIISGNKGTPINILKCFFLNDESTVFDYRLIPVDTVVIELGLSDDSLVVICVANTGVVRARKVGFIAGDFRQHVALFLNAVQSESESAQQSIITSIDMLSAAIIEPLQDVLKRPVRHLVFVPSSSLARFPFALLSTPESSIVFDYTVSQSPSLLIFLELLRRPKVSADIRLSAIANPNVEVRDAYGEVLPPLPFAGFEAMYVAKVFGGYPRLSDGLDGPQLKTLFEECDILHLAAHGELNSEQPLLSMLHLESSFTVVDLANSRCDARLVVFSACVSGLGRITFVDDLLGFSHAVLHSGARAFIGTLWDRDDLASMLFMMMFYKFIKGIGVEAPKSPAVALQQAQRGLIDMDVPDRNLLLREILEMLEDVDYDSSIRAMALKNKPSLEEALAGDNCDFSEPYFWAPFVLVGLGIESIYSPKV